jgi:signal transduction histidine kinase
LPDPPLMFAPLLATYTLAAYRPRRISVPIMGLIVVGSAIAIWGGDGSDAADVAVGYFAGITAWVVGDTTRTQRERSEWMETRRLEEAQQAATRERLAIARDLHDIVAHHVSVIAVQAEAAQSVLAAQPERAGRAMADVADTARVALGELRRLLGVLRSEHDFAPQPGLDAIDDLVDTVRRAGMDVHLSRSVDAPVDAVAGLTAYRVVQEALTNVLKHAGPCATDVALSVSDDVLLVSVVDDGLGPRSANGGHGLVGMRERVSVLGGTLDAGAVPTGGFAVRARLPLSA